MNAKADLCPPSQILAKFGIGKLDPPSAETISQHLETCVECRAAVENAPPDNFIHLVLEAHGFSSSAVSSATVQPTSAVLSLDDLTAAESLADSGDYEIIRPLGRGGMGVVYLARNRVLDRLEVLKAVSKSLLDRPGVVERFQREIRAAARLHHPNVVAVYSAPRFGEQLVLAMEFVDGQNLASVVRERGPLPVADATWYAHQTAMGLQHAHDRGMVHRDIKPGNLMLAQEDQTQILKILDFGLAKVTSEEAQRKDGLTQTGQILGTPDYIAPEQTLDAPHADIRADIYSLGCTLYHLLAGRPPFQAESLYEVMHAHHHVAAEALDRVRPDVPAELAAVVAKMMAKDPAARFQSPLEVAQALVPFFEPGSQTQRSPQADAAIGPSGRLKLSRPIKTTFLAFLVLAAGVLAIVPFKSKTAAELGDSLAASRPSILVPDRDSPQPAVAPFDAKQARAHQEAWAKHLAVPVEQSNSIGMTFVLIPPGEFLMGSSQDEIETLSRAVNDQYSSYKYQQNLKYHRPEVPKHRVAISQPFLITATEVTLAQFRKFVDTTSFVTDAEHDGGGARVDAQGKWLLDPETTWRKPGYATTDDFPVSVVSWNDAVQFCNWLSVKENLKPCYQAGSPDDWILSPDGNGFRLPTEAQWEFACRAGTTTQFSFGDDPGQLSRYGWHWPMIHGTAQPVAGKLTNPFGLFDMHGNVGEWCQDGYLDGYSDTLPSIDPPGPVAGNSRHALRGGGWYYPWNYARSSSRGSARAALGHSFTVGFRVVRVVKSTASAAKSDPVTSEPSVSTVAPVPSGATITDNPRPTILVPDRASPPLAVAPFDAKQARAHQEAWAEHLGVPVKQTNSLGMQLVLIPPGEFMMGSTPEDFEKGKQLARDQGLGRPNSAALNPEKSEAPRHRVRLSRPVLLAATEVKVGQFRQFVEATKYVTDAEKLGSARALVPAPAKNGRYKWLEAKPDANWRTAYVTAPLDEEWPISVVSWNDAVAFCNWLSEKETLTPCYQRESEYSWSLIADGAGYRLPTEAEWEFACRAGTTTLFCGGDDLASLDRFSWNFRFPLHPEGLHAPQHVGEKLPNAFGLFDIHGNVWEWCQDLYSDDYYAHSAEINPQGPSTGPEHVHRGGCWHQAAFFCRSAARDRQAATYRSQLIGFRVARGLAILSKSK